MTWLPVVGYEGRYEVSDEGAVRSTAAVRHGPHLLKIVHRTYSEVCLYKNDKRTMHLVHRLVLEAFLCPCPRGWQARHLDGNTRHNFLGNLRWGTVQQNADDRKLHGTNFWENGDGHVDRIRDLRTAGLSHRAIADWVGMSKSVVGHHLSVN